MKCPTGLFDVGFCLWLVCCVLKESSGAMCVPALLNIGQIASILIMLINEAGSRYRYRLSDVIMIAIIGLFGISAVLSRHFTLEMALIVVFLARHQNIKRLTLIAAVTLVAAVMFVLSLSVIGLTPDGSLEAISSRQARYSFGFEWPSRLPNYFLAVGLYYVTCKEDQTSNYSVLLFIVLSFCVFLLSDSRNPFLCSLLLGAGVQFSRLATRHNSVRWCFMCLVPIFIVGAFLMIVLSWIYDPTVPFLYGVNRLFSNRLLFSHAAFLTEFPSLLGSSTFTSGADPVGVGYLDSSYLRLLFYYGIIPTVVFLALLSHLLWLKVKQHSYFVALCLIVIALHSILEGQLIALQFTPCLLFLPDSIRWLCRERKGDEREETHAVERRK